MSEYQIQEYNKTAAALNELRARYIRPYDVSTTAGMTEAREARATVRTYRVDLEKMRVALKAPALERTRLIDAEAKRITAELLEIETPIDSAIKAEEKHKAEEKATREHAECKPTHGLIFTAMLDRLGKPAVYNWSQELQGKKIPLLEGDFGRQNSASNFRRSQHEKN